VVTVVQNYLRDIVSEAESGDGEKCLPRKAIRFLKVTEDLEKGGEVAHSDVVKAELQARDRQRQLQEAQPRLSQRAAQSGGADFPGLQR